MCCSARIYTAGMHDSVCSSVVQAFLLYSTVSVVSEHWLLKAHAVTMEDMLLSKPQKCKTHDEMCSLCIHEICTPSCTFSYFGMCAPRACSQQSLMPALELMLRRGVPCPPVFKITLSTGVLAQLCPEGNFRVQVQ